MLVLPVMHPGCCTHYLRTLSSPAYSHALVSPVGSAALTQPDINRIPLHNNERLCIYVCKVFSGVELL